MNFEQLLSTFGIEQLSVEVDDVQYRLARESGYAKLVSPASQRYSGLAFEVASLRTAPLIALPYYEYALVERRVPFGTRFRFMVAGREAFVANYVGKALLVASPA
jgi:hypothetical protein